MSYAPPTYLFQQGCDRDNYLTSRRAIAREKIRQAEILKHEAQAILCEMDALESSLKPVVVPAPAAEG